MAQKQQVTGFNNQKSDWAKGCIIGKMKFGSDRGKYGAGAHPTSYTKDTGRIIRRR
jgi:hypothetical protein